MIPDWGYPTRLRPASSTRSSPQGKPVAAPQGELSLAYALATKRHGGALTFVSNAETGTTFTLRLPVGNTAAPDPTK